jgi:hypothetical protein
MITSIMTWCNTGRRGVKEGVDVRANSGGSRVRSQKRAKRGISAER